MTLDNSDAEFLRDNDSLYVMPLRIVPFETPALRRGRLIRNAALNPAIEVFGLDNGASGQILIEDITVEFGRHHFGWKRDEIHPDLPLLKKLARLTSYDVYSLRILFRELEIPLESIDYLTLSPEKQAQLGVYMKSFTKSLIQHIFKETDEDFDEDCTDIVKMLNGKDGAKALQKLQMMAKVLDLPIQAIPKFLQDFADIYMSFSYYQQCLDDIVPMITQMLGEISELRENWQMKQDQNLMQVCKSLIADLSDLTVRTTGRFESFYRNTETMWEGMSAEKFQAMEAMIRGNHVTMGGVLCGLGIKMNAWNKRFPSPNSGSPQARAELIMSSMIPGMEYIKAIDQAAPSASAASAVA